MWSESLSDWVRFKMTTTALRGIDTEGGIDNYLMNLDDRSVAVSEISIVGQSQPALQHFAFTFKYLYVIVSFVL